MKVIGRKVNIMEKESILHLVGQSMMENGKQADTMVLVHFNGLMGVHIKGNGRIVEKMEKESFKELMGQYMKESGQMVNTMVKVNLLRQEVKCIWDFLKMGST